jgi:DNA-binding GntR family transcriptional regulator
VVSGEASEREIDAPTLHQKILGEIEGKIVSGEWPIGFRIPYEVDLAREYGVSRMTVNKVLTQLQRGGLIERVKKSGSFVSLPHTQSAVLQGLEGLASESGARRCRAAGRPRWRAPPGGELYPYGGRKALLPGTAPDQSGDCA